jgi:hypothetical protein
MTEAEMIEQLSDLSALYPFGSTPNGEARKEAWIRQLFRRFGFLAGAVWRDVVRWVIDHHEGTYPPTVVVFAKAVEAVRSRSGVPGAPKCRLCGGTGMTMAYYAVPELYDPAKVVSAARPCPDCNQFAQPEIPKGAPGNPAVREVTRAEYESYITLCLARAKPINLRPPDAGSRSISDGTGESATTAPPAPSSIEESDQIVGDEREL